MTTAASGTSAPSANNADLASIPPRSLCDACAAWAHDFAAKAHASAMTALRRVTTDYKAGAIAHMTRDHDPLQSACLDLSSGEFHLTLQDLGAPSPDTQRWSIDLQDGVMHVRLWDASMSRSRQIAITRDGVNPVVHTARIESGSRIEIEPTTEEKSA